MTSIQAKIAKIILQIQPYSWAKGTVDEQRSRQEKSTRFFKIPKQIQCIPLKINDISAEWISGSGAEDGLILYLHGGAYSLGSINVHREYLARLAITTRKGTCNQLPVGTRTSLPGCVRRRIDGLSLATGAGN